MDKQDKKNIVAKAKTALLEFNRHSNFELVNKAITVIDNEMQYLTSALHELRNESPANYINALCKIKTTFIPEIDIELETEDKITAIEFVVSDNIELGNFENKNKGKE